MTEQQCSPYRKMIAMTVSIIAKEAGFDSIDKDALGTLTEMMQACKYPSFVRKIIYSYKCVFFLAVLCELGLLSRNYCELSGRVEPLIADVIMAFAEIGKTILRVFAYWICTKV